MKKEQELILHARWWTYHRQLLGQAADNLEQVLHDVIGVYSSHPSAPLSLWARTASFTPDAFRQLEREKRAFRIPAMRHAIYLMGCNDAAMAFTATRLSYEQNMGLLRYNRQYYSNDAFSVEAYPRLKTAILALAREPLTPKQLRERLKENVDDLAILARIVAYEGELLRVGSDNLRSNSLRYVSASAWGARLLNGLDQSTALQVLAQRYLWAFGPARIKDFQWWAGINLEQATAAFATLNTVTLADGSLLLTDDLAEFERVAQLPADAIDILPRWDSYTMGYAPDGRARIVDSQVQSRLYASLSDSGGGDALGAILVAGKAVATWSSTCSGKYLEVKLDLFDQSALPYMQAISARFEEVATILNATSCSVNLLDSAGPSLASSLLSSRRRKTEER